MLSKSTEYGIRALVFIQLQNWENRRPGVAETAKEIEAPVAFTAKILHQLTTHQLLESMKGRGGGFFFKDNQSDLSLYDVILVLEGDRLFTKCGFGLKNCSETNPCPMHYGYMHLRDGLINLAKKETIATMAQKVLDGVAVLNRAAPLQVE
jgi:Rrf2 family protein